MPDVWYRVPCAGGSCVEWRRLPDGSVMLRSTELQAGVARFTAAEWAALIAAYKNGDLDLVPDGGELT
jgi:hypothetical protein